MSVLDHLNLYCGEIEKDRCMDFLKQSLKKDSQVNYYNYIYDSFTANNSLEEHYDKIIIPGLDRVIKLLILSMIFRNVLFPNLNDNIDYESNDEIIGYLNQEYFSIEDFIHTCKMISLIFYKKEIFSIEKQPSFPKNRFCVPYILIHKAGNLSFESLSSMLFESSYSKIPISFKLFSDSNGPHDGRYKNQCDFFRHDLLHMNTTLINISRFKNNITETLNSLNKGTFKRRVIEIFIIAKTFENTKDLSFTDLDMFDDLLDFINIVLKTFDIFDIPYVLKYLVDSYDLPNKEIIVFNFMNFKTNYDKFLYIPRDILKAFGEGDYVINAYNEKHSLNMEEGETKEKLKLIEKVSESFGLLIVNFYNLNLKNFLILLI